MVLWQGGPILRHPVRLMVVTARCVKATWVWLAGALRRSRGDLQWMRAIARSPGSIGSPAPWELG